MPTKHRVTKGRSKTEERKVSKSGRKRIEPAKRMLATYLYVEQGKSKREVSKELDILPSTVGRIANRATDRATDLRIPLLNISNFQDRNEHVGAPKKLTKEEEDEICDYVVKSRDNRDKETFQHIADLKLDISISTFNQIMYDRNYCRRKHGWKTLLDTPTRGKRFAWAKKYRQFNFRRRIVSTNEASIRKGERRGYMRTWRKVNEKYDKDVVENKQSTYSDG